MAYNFLLQWSHNVTFQVSDLVPTRHGPIPRLISLRLRHSSAADASSPGVVTDDAVSDSETEVFGFCKFRFAVKPQFHWLSHQPVRVRTV